MPRYIDADLLVQEIEAETPLNFMDSEAELQAQLDFRVFKHMVDYQPTADVVEVIHCKNCQYYYKGISTRCTHPNGLKAPDDSTWCSFGERKQTND